MEAEMQQKAEDEKKTYQEFEFSEDGIKAAVAWLNEVT